MNKMSEKTRKIQNRNYKVNAKTNRVKGWRFGVIYGGIFISLVGLVSKFVFLQIVEAEDLVKENDIRSIRTQEVNVPRGIITDRAGRTLAISVPVEAIWMDPKILLEKGGVNKHDPRWVAFADVLGLSLDVLINRSEQNKSARFVYLARQVNPEIVDYIRQLKLPGINYEKESKRYYPLGEVSAHLVGFTDIDGNGIEGVEGSFDSWLTSISGEKVIRKDRFGRAIEKIALVEGKKAQDLTLSIDERLQSVVYRELSQAVSFNKAESGTAVLVDIETGEILAMANSPSYNPNNRMGIPTSFMRNRAITDVFEPGSTVKPIVVMAALNSKIIGVNSVINTAPYYINKHEIKDVSWQQQLTPEGILQKSSNVGVSKLALKMKPSQLVDIYSKFGFGEATQLGLIGESKGYNGKNKKYWSDIERATYSFGYGLTATPLQLAKVYATIGSFGISRPFSILKVNKPVDGNRVFPETVTRTVVKMMESVALPGGGGTKAAVHGYRVAVKTGTAKKVGANGKYVNQYIAYTAGIAPASNPKYALVVAINNPKAGKYYGGTVSAPVFGNIMGSTLRTMNIEPDALPDNSIVINR